MNTVELREEKYVDQGKMNGPTSTKIKSAWNGFCPVADDNTLLYAASYLMDPDLLHISIVQA